MAVVEAGREAAPSGPPLPHTGADGLGLVGLGLALVGAGLLLTAATTGEGAGPEPGQRVGSTR